jgi:hypothetical protein
VLACVIGSAVSAPGYDTLRKVAHLHCVAGGSFLRFLEIEFGPARSDHLAPWYAYVFATPADAEVARFSH